MESALSDNHVGKFGRKIDVRHFESGGLYRQTESVNRLDVRDTGVVGLLIKACADLVQACGIDELGGGDLRLVANNAVGVSTGYNAGAVNRNALQHAVSVAVAVTVSCGVAGVLRQSVEVDRESCCRRTVAVSVVQSHGRALSCRRAVSSVIGEVDERRATGFGVT